MQKKGISQETLKLFACVTMLLDHIGATLVPGWTLRIIGRVAFPIFCFLLAEGAHYTRNPGKYALRLFIGVLLSELPFDFSLFGGWTMRHQSVMVTMLLGFLALEAMKRAKPVLLRLLVALPFILAAEWLHTDYGGDGVILIVMFGLTRELPFKRLWQTTFMIAICGILMPGALVRVGSLRIGVELFAVLAMIPISLYDGRKLTHSKAAQWGFYLFYPVHLTVLLILQLLR